MAGETDEIRWRGVRPIAGIRGIWPARNATRINKAGYKDGYGTVLIYTVPADKKLFISSVTMASRLAGEAETRALTFVEDADNVELYRMACHLYNFAGQQNCHVVFWPALEANETDRVCMCSYNAEMDVRAYVHGWLEDE